MIDTIKEQMPQLMLALAFTVGEYVLVLCAVVADLASGLRKARRRGEARRSKALRRTVEKLATYYNVLAALTVIDAMQMAAVVYVIVSIDEGGIPITSIIYPSLVTSRVVLPLPGVATIRVLPFILSAALSCCGVRLILYLLQKFIISILFSPSSDKYILP